MQGIVDGGENFGDWPEKQIPRFARDDGTRTPYASAKKG